MTDTALTPLDTVRAFLSAMEKGEYDTGVQFISDTCEYANPGVLPTVYGPTGVRQLLEPFFAPTLENDHRLATGWVELPVTGVFEVHDGRITLWRDYFNGPTILNAWPS
jgi:limonene-1,2-epoxide hydrolase